MTDILFSIHAAELLSEKKRELNENINDILTFETDIAFEDISGLDENFDGFAHNGKNKHTRKAVSELRRIKETNGTVRVWLCPSDAGELLSLMYICYALKDTKCHIICALIPSMHMSINSMTRIYSSDELTAEVLDENISRHVRLSVDNISFFASEFKRIQQSPETLRININGRITCIPEDTFDQIILSEISSKPTHAAVILGQIQTKVLGLKIPFIYGRLMYLAQKGVITYTDKAGTEFFSLAD